MRTLFIPGPVNLSTKIKALTYYENYSQNQKVIKDSLKEIRNKIKKLIVPNDEDEYEVILFSASGSGSIESVLSSIGHSKILNIVNGKYGLRMFEISNRYRKTSKKIFNDSGEIYGLNYKMIEEELTENDYDYATIVHVEEATGIKNDINKIGTLCANNNTKLIVDACSSFGALPINMKHMNISILIGCFDKCVEGVSGLSFVAIEKNLLKDLAENKKETFYFDLYTQYMFLEKYKKLRFSPSIFSILSNNLALTLLTEEGIENRYERYKNIWQEIIKRSQMLEIEFVVPVNLQSYLITSFHEPQIEHFDFNDLFSFLEEKNIIIHPGKFSDFPTFRLANMGQLTIEDVKRLFNYLNDYLSTIN